MAGPCDSSNDRFFLGQIDTKLLFHYLFKDFVDHQALSMKATGARSPPKTSKAHGGSKNSDKTFGDGCDP